MPLGGADGSEEKKRRKRKHEPVGVHKKNVEKQRGKLGVSFCPRCGSTNIFWASGLPQLWSIWDCRNCGYRGAFVLRDGKLAEKLSRDYKKSA
jgi:predicted RNA-binding Zn-ribbon protein involved in translation (DUF1610 family)